MSDSYDHARLVELFGGDPATLAEVERAFVDTTRDAEREILASDDCAAIATAAHRLKGTAGMVGASALRLLAETIERAARAHDLAGVRRQHEALTREVRRIARQADSACAIATDV